MIKNQTISNYVPNKPLKAANDNEKPQLEEKSDLLGIISRNDNKKITVPPIVDAEWDYKYRDNLRYWFSDGNMCAAKSFLNALIEYNIECPNEKRQNLINEYDSLINQWS